MSENENAAPQDAETAKGDGAGADSPEAVGSEVPAAGEAPRDGVEKAATAAIASAAATEAKGDRIFGISIHNLIFVGLILGVILGWFIHSLDHHDDVILKSGGSVMGLVREAGSEYVVRLESGDEERVPRGDVKSIKFGSDKRSGWIYDQSIWWLNLFGKTIFMGLLKMLIAPLILSSIIAGIVSLRDLDELKRIGLKTIAYYVLSTLVAVSIGLLAVLTIRPGYKASSRELHKRRAADLRARAAEYQRSTGKQAVDSAGQGKEGYLIWLAKREAERAGSGHEAARFTKLSGAKGVSAGERLKRDLIGPMLENPFMALSKRNSLGIIFFSLLFGIAVVCVGPTARPVADLFVGLSDVIIWLTKKLMLIAPFCILCIVAELIGKNGPNVFGSLAWYCITVIAGIGLHVCFLVAVAWVVGGCPPKRLWTGIREAWLVAFTTRSSAATLPVTLRCATKNLGVSPRVANFGLPVGATLNMDGTALYEGVAIIFLIQIYQGLADVPIELGGAVTLIIFVTAVLASVGAAAVPDAGLVTMVLVATAVGLPVYYIPLIFAVDAFLDMFRTSTNILGDTVGTIVVQRLEDKRLGVLT